MIEHARAFEIEAEPDFGKSLFTHGMAQLHLVLRIEHEKAAAAGAD